MAGILNGIKIVDFTQGHTGSYGTMMLADFGAEVIKIEDAGSGGDILRYSFPKNKDGSAYHAYMNRGKKSICVDRHSEKGREIILRLIEKADVVCDSFVAGELENCGLGYESACMINPDIIYAYHTGFGKTGPMSCSAGCDLTSEALSGLMQITGFPDGNPTAHGSRIADQFGGHFYAAAIIMALMVRDRTGMGQQIDVASADCMLTALEDCIAEAFLKGITFHREGNGSRSIAPYDTFEVKDGIFSTAVSTNSQWKKFCEAMGMESLINDERYNSNEARGENYYTENGKTGLRDIIAEKFKDMTRQEIVETLRPWNIPSGPGLTVQDAFEDEQLNVRNMVLEVKDKALGMIRMPGIPIKMSDVDDIHVRPAPRLGEDTKAILLNMGFDTREIADLSEKNVVICKRGDI